jgi:antitoxin (DNA-binding transcriptional repressor) of toxin-antitoxin stability system
MRTVSLLEFRKNAEATLQQVAAGQSIVLTRRGLAVARLEPVGAEHVQADDPLYTLGDLAVEGDSLTNEEMDREIYGR